MIRMWPALLVVFASLVTTHCSAPPTVECMGGPALSPDGRTGAFARTVLVESENRRHSEIWTVPADGCGGATPLVAGAARHAARVRFAALSGFSVGLL